MTDTLMQWAAEQRGSVIQRETESVKRVVDSIVQKIKQSIEEALKEHGYLIPRPSGWKDHKDRLIIIFSDVGICLREESGTGKLSFDLFN